MTFPTTALTDLGNSPRTQFSMWSVGAGRDLQMVRLLSILDVHQNGLRAFKNVLTSWAPPTMIWTLLAWGGAWLCSQHFLGGCVDLWTENHTDLICTSVLQVRKWTHKEVK